MPEYALVSSVCTSHGGHLIYRSEDGLIGLAITSSSGREDRSRYFVWALPDNAAEYATEEEARAALATPGKRARRTRRRA